MKANLYLTADTVGAQSGGGIVTKHELIALSSLGACALWDRRFFESRLRDQSCFAMSEEPWLFDDVCASLFADVDNYDFSENVPIAHVYAGTFTKTLHALKSGNVKITYTAAAHDVAKSRRAHEELGIAFNYPHLTDEELWKRYLGGYLAADVLICPSTHARDVMRNFGYDGRIEIIPHGCELPDETKPSPEKFTVGYLGAVGPDKGLRYLFEAWSRLDYGDAELVVGGLQSQSGLVKMLLNFFNCKNVRLAGWYNDVSDFYNAISVLVQPSVSEGFGIEVLEALAHGRPVVCSDGAGACDLVREDMIAPSCDGAALAERIDAFRRAPPLDSKDCRAVAEQYTWARVRQLYVNVWKELLTKNK